MKPRLILYGLALVTVTFIAASEALALPAVIGDPQPGNSWSVRFREDGNYKNMLEEWQQYSFDRMEITMISGSLESPDAFSGFSVDGWMQSNNDGTVAIAVGPAVDYLEWDYTFQGDVTDPLSFHAETYAGDDLLGTTRFEWTPGDWIYEYEDCLAPIGDPQVIPESSSLLLWCMVGGVFAIGSWFRRRRRIPS